MSATASASLPLTVLRADAEATAHAPPAPAPAVMSEVWVVADHSLSSQTKRTGRPKTPAQFRPFKKWTPVDRAIAEDVHHDPVIAQKPDAMGRPRANGDIGGDDAIRPKHTDREIRDMHRAALAAAAAALAAQKLFHHRGGVRALGERMTMPAMGRQEQIVAAERRHDAGGAGLLPDGQVNGAKDQTIARGGKLCLALERPNAFHHPQKSLTPRSAS
jgi:hypothetical protein